MSDLSGAQKKYLRGLAHELKPVVHVGRNGLTEGVFESLEEALEAHELIKVKLRVPRHQKRELAAAIDARLGSAQAGTIGHVVILYRPAGDPEKRAIRLPA